MVRPLARDRRLSSSLRIAAGSRRSRAAIAAFTTAAPAGSGPPAAPRGSRSPPKFLRSRNRPNAMVRPISQDLGNFRRCAILDPLPTPAGRATRPLRRPLPGPLQGVAMLGPVNIRYPDGPAIGHFVRISYTRSGFRTRCPANGRSADRTSCPLGGPSAVRTYSRPGRPRTEGVSAAPRRDGAACEGCHVVPGLPRGPRAAAWSQGCRVVPGLPRGRVAAPWSGQ